MINIAPDPWIELVHTSCETLNIATYVKPCFVVPSSSSPGDPVLFCDSLKKKEKEMLLTFIGGT